MTFAFLMAIAFLPFPTLLIGEFFTQQISVVFCAADAAVASLLLVGISSYARHGHRLVPEDVDDERGRLRTAQGLAVPVVFLASIAISFWSPRAALYCWWLLLVTDPAVAWAWRGARHSAPHFSVRESGAGNRCPGASPDIAPQGIGYQLGSNSALSLLVRSEPDLSCYPSVLSIILTGKEQAAPHDPNNTNT
jgi:hypothetical protein